jgi:NADPH-dependent glutamate synthase beta subunit-like oxidoreductase/NAD-dependent dihydropyrimidine dehydrogenase PreA subunit
MKVLIRVAQVDDSKCVGCRICAMHCPSEAITVKKKEGIFFAQCQEACPAGIDVAGYVALAGQGRIQEAYQVIRRENPLPSVCGRICSHPCQTKCSRGEYDEPVAIMDVKRYVTDYVFNNGLAPQELIWPKNGKSIGIIGAGPSGLSCAYYLALSGYEVDVYENGPAAGGMLLTGIPKYRLPREILERDISLIEQTGVKIHLNTEIGKDITFAELRKKHNAVYLAMGTQLPRKVGVQGEDLPGVWHGLDFLRDVNLDKKPLLGKKVVVIGGGNVAIDTALTALRMGAQKVSAVCLERRAEMPAFEDDIAEAQEDGIEIINSLGPKKFLGTNAVTGVEFMRCTAVFNETGAFCPAYAAEDTVTIEADTVIVSIGQSSNLSFAPVLAALGRITTDAATRMTPIEGVFAGGDLVRGPNVAVAAIADGKQAAQSIHTYLTKQGMINKGAEIAVPERDTEWDQRRKSIMKHLPSAERKKSFAEVNLGITAEQVNMESKRCLRCVKGISHIDPTRCVDCELCVEYCTHDAVKMVPLDKKDQRTIAYQVREEQRPAILELCKKAHIYPLELLCGCNWFPAEEVAAAILDGHRTVQDITLATGARSGCGGIICHAKIARLLHAAGIENIDPPTGQSHTITTDLWTIPQAVADKYPVLRINIEQKKIWNPKAVESVETAWGRNLKTCEEE